MIVLEIRVVHQSTTRGDGIAATPRRFVAAGAPIVFGAGRIREKVRVSCVHPARELDQSGVGRYSPTGTARIATRRNQVQIVAGRPHLAVTLPVPDTRKPDVTRVERIAALVATSIAPAIRVAAGLALAALHPDELARGDIYRPVAKVAGVESSHGHPVYARRTVRGGHRVVDRRVEIENQCAGGSDRFPRGLDRGDQR